jgi:carboxyl-terminal processing protease
MKKLIPVGKRKSTLIVGVLVAISVFVLAFTESDDFKFVKNIEIYTSLFRELNLYYVDDTDPEKLIKSSIDEMLKTLDPYTVYIPESELGDLRFVTTGEYGGIGSIIRKSGDHAVISEIYKDFPADKAKLKAGDLIMKVDGKPTRGLEITEISDLLKGAPGTELEIILQRPGSEEPITQTLVRKKIQVKSVPYYGILPNRIGYIRLTNFTMGAGEEVKEALVALKHEYDLAGLVLDVRGNPGGLLIEAVNVTNLFVPRGSEVVSTRGKVKEYDHTYYAKESPVDTLLPVAVLVSRNSASSSEILAGAIQDLDRGIIIGERTYGKGLVQTTRPLSYNSQLKVTTAKYYIPSGRCIQALDYTNRNEDGSVGHIPDSLISEYSTKNGRKVYDGGGIVPDIQIKPESLSQIAVELYTRFLIFDFATQYTLLHPSIGPVEDFWISDADYQKFIAFTEDRNFDYKTQTEEAFKKLENTAKREKYFGLAEQEFLLLKEKISHNLSKDLQSFKGEIKELLSQEIVGRYYYQEGRIQSSLSADNQVAGAIEALGDLEEYISLLNGKKDAIVAEIN